MVLPKSSLLSPRRAMPALFSIVLLVLAACTPPGMPAAGPSPAASSDLTLMKRVMDRVQADYVVPVPEKKLVVDGLKGMLAGLDPHSDYLDESEYQELISDSEGEFAGIGIEINREDNRLRIISPIDDTPAANAGLKAGDTIARIDGEPTDGMTLRNAVEKLRGPAGSAVRITIERGNVKPFDVTLTRAVIRIASVKSKLEPGRIGYVRIVSFGEHTESEFLAALDQLQRRAGGPLAGFVLDLRNDPGGLLDTAVRVAGDFLDDGVVVTTRGRHQDDDETYSASRDGDKLKGVPVTVLINGASASASEIVAGALQDRKRATLIGTRSFGKGSVQTIIPLDGQGALRLTTARYYTPSGRSIQGDGIVPDIVVLPSKDAADIHGEIVHEGNLPGALKNDTLKAGLAKPSETTNDITMETKLIGTDKDNQLNAALARLRGKM
ncbi:MAG TPA: S41 family peptidase [Stellaceae bacterium]|jgi:carboxyl-terminal processing protease|nr:S41 family peptidase [Stellaceae bacterium]